MNTNIKEELISV